MDRAAAMTGPGAPLIRTKAVYESLFMPCVMDE